MKEIEKILYILKKIFTLQFLAVVIGIISLYITYKTFIRDDQGEITFMIDGKELNKNISIVYYGFFIESDSIDIYSLKDFPILANTSSKTIEDFTLYAYTLNIPKSFANNRYNVAQGSGDNTIAYEYNLSKIKPLEGVYWPINALYTNKREILVYPIKLIYSYKTKEASEILLYIIGIPHQKTIEKSEEVFTKTINPYLIENNDSKHTAIIFNKQIIQKPTLKKGVNYKSLTELK